VAATIEVAYRKIGRDERIRTFRKTFAATNYVCCWAKVDRWQKKQEQTDGFLGVIGTRSEE